FTQRRVIQRPQAPSPQIFHEPALRVFKNLFNCQRQASSEETAKFIYTITLISALFDMRHRGPYRAVSKTPRGKSEYRRSTLMNVAECNLLRPTPLAILLYFGVSYRPRIEIWLHQVR